MPSNLRLEKLEQSLRACDGAANDGDYICSCRPMDVREALKEIERLRAAKGFESKEPLRPDEKKITNARLDELIGVFKPYRESRCTSAQIHKLLCELREYRKAELAAVKAKRNGILL